MSNENNKFLSILIFICACIGIYLIYLLIVWASRAFVIWGYNSIFFIDNLFDLKIFNPVVIWGINGLLVGSIIGVVIAVKKHKLSKILILYPLSLVALIITIMSFVNKPAQHSGLFNSLNVIDSTNLKSYFLLNNIANVRSGPSLSNSKLFSLQKGTEVEVIQKGIYDSENVEWYKIIYDYKQGYICSKLLNYSRSVN